MDVHKRKGYIDLEIGIREQLVTMNSFYDKLREKLTNAYKHKENVDLEIKMWNELIKKNSFYEEL